MKFVSIPMGGPSTRIRATQQRRFDSQLVGMLTFPRLASQLAEQYDSDSQLTSFLKVSNPFFISD